MKTNKAIDDEALEATAAKVKGYCELRFSEGATREMINAELKERLPDINKYARRQRQILQMLSDAAARPLKDRP